MQAVVMLRAYSWANFNLKCHHGDGPMPNAIHASGQARALKLHRSIHLGAEQRSFATGTHCRRCFASVLIYICSTRPNLSLPLSHCQAAPRAADRGPAAAPRRFREAACCHNRLAALAASLPLSSLCYVTSTGHTSSPVVRHSYW